MPGKRNTGLSSADLQLKAALKAIYGVYGSDLSAFFRDVSVQELVERKAAEALIKP